MKQTVDAPSGLRWTVKRLILPTGMRPLTRTDMLDVATPRRTAVDGVSRQVPDAYGAWTGPLPLGFLLVPLVLPLVPLVLLLRRMRWLPWTIEARAHPWGRRYPPVVLTYAIRGGEESRRAFGQLVEALARGEGAPRIDGAEKLGQARQSDSGTPVVGTSGPRQFGKR
jgi:hypothetical protein